MTSIAKTTPNYSIPLSWDKYPTDRKLIEEAFERIDAAIEKVADSGGSNSENIEYETPDGTEVSVADALNVLYSRTATFEIAVNATTGCDAGEVLWALSATRAFTLPAELIGSQATIKQLSAPVYLTIAVMKNDISVGNILIDDNLATYDLPDAVDFAVGDELSFVAASNVTFKSIAITLSATRPD